MGTIAGLALIVLGLAAVGLSLVRGRGEQPTASATTTIVRPVTTSTTTEVVGEHGGTTIPLGGHEVGDGTAPSRGGRSGRRGFGEALVTITTKDGSTCRVCLLAAYTEAQRQRGLMEAADPKLGGYDGMLFVFPKEIQGSFWMRNTPQPLSIAYFDGSRRFVSAVDMAPCTDTPQCESYPSGGPFQFAIEVPEGRFTDLLPKGGVGAGTRFAVEGWNCPLAKGDA